jgi:hypothetical protein
MSPRIALALLVCAAIAACGGPETYHQRSGLGGNPGTAGQTGTAGVTGTAGSAPAGAAGDGSMGVAGMGLAGDNGTGVAGSVGTAGQTGTAGAMGTAGVSGAAGIGAAGTMGTAGMMGMAGTMGTAGMGGAGGKGGAGGMGVAGGAGGMGGAGGAGGVAGGAAGAGGAGGTPLPTLRIDAAGTANPPWLADVDFVGGNPGQTVAGAIDVTGVTNPAPQTVYLTTRIGGFTYTIPNYTANSMHTVRIHMCETYFPPPGDTMGGANRRLCNITINGAAVLPNYDIFVKAGNAKMKAVVEQFSIAANGTGQYVIQFTPTKDNCSLGGLEVQ